jgi:hypothetical protein
MPLLAWNELFLTRLLAASGSQTRFGGELIKPHRRRGNVYIPYPSMMYYALANQNAHVLVPSARLVGR